jgi:hypothetical protein
MDLIKIVQFDVVIGLMEKLWYLIITERQRACALVQPLSSSS